MIRRYSRPEMTALWDDRNRYRVWLEVEFAVCEEMRRMGKISNADWGKLKRAVERLQKKGGVRPERVEKHEQVTRHDVIAFTTAVAEEIGPISRYIHYGLTSSDVVDTALALLVKRAGLEIRAAVVELVAALRKRAIEFKGLPTIGRTHGQFAEPTSFGLKFLGWHCEWQRNLARLDLAIAGISYGKLSGAVGASPHWDVKFEKRVLKRLGLQREPVSTQVIPRDRLAEFLQVIALCGASLERIAVELRHLQRSEVAEVCESFGKGQKGSSAMPHKRNPISSENLTGIARLLRGYAQVGLENVALWHERDISHSSAERVSLPDATIAADYAIRRMRGVIAGLEVDRARVAKNLASAGEKIFSGHYLLALVEAGATRENAYAWVQECALLGAQNGSFNQRLKRHPKIAKLLSSTQIDRLGSLKYQLREVDAIYAQALRLG